MKNVPWLAFEFSAEPVFPFSEKCNFTVQCN